MSNFLSLIFYLLFFSLSALLLYYGNKKKNNVIIGLSLTIPIIIGGFRLNVGTDYDSYIRMYQSFLNVPFVDYFNNISIEPGFYLLIKLSQFISNDTYVLFLLSSTFTILAFYLGLKITDPKHKGIIFLLFLIIIYPITFNATRQGISISICFLALSHLIGGHPKKFFFWVIAAATFHVSSLVCIIAYFIRKLLISSRDSSQKNRFLFENISFVIFCIVIIPIIFPNLPNISIISKYIEYGDYISGVSITTIMFKIIIVLIITYFYKKISRKSPYASDYYTLGLLEISTIGLWISSAVLFRISLLFTTFNLILLSEIIDTFDKRFDKHVIQAIIIIFALVYFYVAYYVAGQAEIVPYNFVRF